MGLFGRKAPEDRRDRAMTQAENIAAGKGVTGKLMKGLMGSDNAARLGSALDATRQTQTAMSLQQQGAPTTTATVDAIGDTGQLVNFDPVVDLALTLTTGERINLQTLVSKLQVPRPGDIVMLVPDPQHPGHYLYAGPAPR